MTKTTRVTTYFAGLQQVAALTFCLENEVTVLLNSSANFIFLEIIVRFL